MQNSVLMEFITIYITIKILDIIHRPVFCLKHNISETEFCLRLQVEPTQLCPIDRASLYLHHLVSRDRN
jgi:hypothetical protein